MPIARRLKWYLDSHHVDYEVISHIHTSSMSESARAAHIPAGRVAKCVLLEDERGYVMAIVPASCVVNLHTVEDELGRHLDLASESEIGDLFVGCEAGAMPPVGAAFNIPTAIDNALLRLPDVYFEEGDHEGMVHVSGEVFRALFSGSRAGRFGRLH
jgi:Ala-tRNA(Pro) deacylase